MTPVTHPRLHRILASVLAALMLSGSLVPVAFGAAVIRDGAPRRSRRARPARRRHSKRKRVRVTKRVRVRGKMKRKRVWVKKLVWVCVPAAATKTAGDVQAPSAPAGLDAIAGNGQVTLVWNPASDNVAVTGYRVYRDGAPVASPGTAGHTDSGLTNGRAYTYGVAAVDAAGNVSATATISATPKGPAAKDVTAPSAPPAFTRDARRPPGRAHLGRRDRRRRRRVLRTAPRRRRHRLPGGPRVHRRPARQRDDLRVHRARHRCGRERLARRAASRGRPRTPPRRRPRAASPPRRETRRCRSPGAPRPTTSR